MSAYSIADNFNQYFQIKFADTKALRREAFKIRYGVYSSELGWEPENKQQMETDECDDYSYHCVLEHRRTGVFAGCIRIVIPPVVDPSLQLPFEKFCLHAAISDVIDSTKMSRGSFGEISRLAVLSSFRRRDRETSIPFVLNNLDPETVYSEQERRNFPNIAMGLYLSGVALADILNHVGMFVMMEKRLNKRLIRFGLPFIQVGKELDYHGMRAMFFLDRKDFQSKLTQELSLLYQVIYNNLMQQMFLLPFTNARDK